MMRPRNGYVLVVTRLSGLRCSVERAASRTRRERQPLTRDHAQLSPLRVVRARSRGREAESAAADCRYLVMSQRSTSHGNATVGPIATGRPGARLWAERRIQADCRDVAEEGSFNTYRRGPSCVLVVDRLRGCDEQLRYIDDIRASIDGYFCDVGSRDARRRDRLSISCANQTTT